MKKLLARAMLDNAALKDPLSRNGDIRCEAGGGRASYDGTGDERAAGCPSVVVSNRPAMVDRNVLVGDCLDDHQTALVALATADGHPAAVLNNRAARSRVIESRIWNLYKSRRQVGRRVAGNAP
jgi:hypothetical protein